MKKWVLDLGELKTGQTVTVPFEGDPCNVTLLDNDNIAKYTAGTEHKYAGGGYFEQPPIVLRIPHDGHWHLGLDFGRGIGGSGKVADPIVSA